MPDLNTETKPETLYLIDGYAEIFRAHYAIRNPLFSPTTGEPTNGLLVFAQMLLKLFTTLQPDYVVVALDMPGATFREALYTEYAEKCGVVRAEETTEETTGEVIPTFAEPVEKIETVDVAPPGRERVLAGYKGLRRETPDALHQQVPRILEMLGHFGVPVIGRPGLEADDIIATLTDRVLLEHPQVRVRIVSRDKDLEQLLSERVTLYDIQTATETDERAMLARRGITPAQVPDLLALIGDAVDNIPGVPGIGPKTAAKLIQQFGTLDGILENLDQLKGSWRENLERDRDLLPISRRMVTLERDPEIPFVLESARARPVEAAALLPFFEELGFARLLTRFDGKSPKSP